MTDLEQAQNRLLADQFSYGEWGQCESSGAARDLEMSRLKPNFFSSSEAAFSLVASGLVDPRPIVTYLDWIQQTRSSDGWWYSAAGSNAPGKNSPSWVPNIRHTAKGIDVRILANQFDGEDLRNISPLCNLQHSTGAFPQFPGGLPDLWSTLYVLNLLITVTRNDEASRISRPSSASPNAWESGLKTRIERCRAWLTDQMQQGDHWELRGAEPGWVTQAVAIEFGAHLAESRPDVSSAVAKFLLSLPGRDSPKTLWALLCMWIALSPVQQSEVKTRLSSFVYREELDTLSMACCCRLLACDRDPLLVQYYLDASRRHSAALPRWEAWARTEYVKWSVQRANASQPGNAMSHGVIITKADLWLTVSGLLHVYKDGIEKSGDWRVLWKSATEHVDEAGLQQHFMSLARGLAKSWGISAIKEPHTGSGPVDFEFANGLVARIQVEFKRMDHPRIQHGLDSQLPKYMRSDEVDCGIFVCVGFDDDSEIRYNKVVIPTRDKARSEHPDIWLETIYIDARRQASASR